MVKKPQFYKRFKCTKIFKTAAKHLTNYPFQFDKILNYFFIAKNLWGSGILIKTKLGK